MRNPEFARTGRVRPRRPAPAGLAFMALAALAALPAGAWEVSGTVADTAGHPIDQAWVRSQDDTTVTTFTDAQGKFRLTGTVSLRGPAKAARPELRLVAGRDGRWVESPSALNLRMDLRSLDGAMARAGEARLRAGRNPVEGLVGGALPPGAYILRLRGNGLDWRACLAQGSRPASGGPRVLAKAADGYPSAVAAGKAGYSPMLREVKSASDTGVTVTLKMPLPAKLAHVVVIYLENWSFDALYGQFPGAANLDSAAAYAAKQVDSTGAAYAHLPQPFDTDHGHLDSLFPDTLANMPFDLTRFVHLNQTIPDLVHRYYQEQLQIDSGKMDRFAQVSNARGLSMGYFPTDSLPLAAIAKQYTLCDRFFHSAFGGSFLNHMWLVAARTPMWADIPAKYRAQIDSATGQIKMNGNYRTYFDGQATPDGYLVNTIYTHNNPHPATAAADQLVPDLDFPTIGDRLNDKGIGWAWYAGGWDSATAGHPDSAFQFHHQPFAFFKNYADGKPAKAQHLKDEKDFRSALSAGTLPAVSFIKPVGINNEHPSYADVKTGELHTKALIDAIKASPAWDSTVIVVTYDENGGFWDHVAPPKSDKWGPGTRVPGIVVSPFARKGFVDKRTYETVSILALIERRFGVLPLTGRDANAADLSGTLDIH